MMFEEILTIIIVALSALFAWSVFKGFFKLLLYVGIALTVIVAANTYLIYRDIVDLRENFSESTKKVILVDGNKIVAGFLLNSGVSSLGSSRLDEYASYLKGGDYEKILGDDYRLMIFDVSIVSSLDAEIDIDGRIIPRDDAISLLRSSEASETEKAGLFSSILITNILPSENPLFFFSEFKKGNIKIYPETALFKIAKIIPLSVIKDIGISIFETTKEKAKSFVAQIE